MIASDTWSTRSAWRRISSTASAEPVTRYAVPRVAAAVSASAWRKVTSSSVYGGWPASRVAISTPLTRASPRSGTTAVLDTPR